MKKVKIFSIIVLALSVTGCLKDKPNVDFSNITAVAEISSGSLVSDNSPISGIDYFSKATLPSFSKDAGCGCFLPDTVTFDVNITGVYPPTSDVTVNLALDDTKRVSANAYFKNIDPNATQYQTAPDSIYTLLTKTLVVKSGSRLAKASIVFYPAKIDPSTSYLFPISITNASGILISGNLGTIYLHNLGNPLAGLYTVTGTRYNYTGVVSWAGPPAAVPASYVATTNLGNYSPKSASPDNTTTVETPFANVGAGYNYVITYTASSQSISVTYSAPILAYSNIQTFIVNFVPPSATQKASFHIVTHYNNAAGGSGNDRIIDETFTQQ